MLTAEEIKSIADSGEGYNVDFKISVPSKVRDLSQEVCAFANSEGGYLLIGIDDKGRIVGVEIDNAKRSAIQNSIRDISPAMQVEMYPVDVDDKTVWVIDIPSGKDKPYVISGAIYVREGANSQKLTTAEEIRSFFPDEQPDLFRCRSLPAVRCKQRIGRGQFQILPSRIQYNRECLDRSDTG